MNKIYSLLGSGLLIAATLTSCKEDSLVDGQEVVHQESLQSYIAEALIHSYSDTDKQSSSRANVAGDGHSFMWNSKDQVTIWNGTAGYGFHAVDYDETEPSGNVVFTGDADLTDGETVWGIYPSRQDATLDNVFVFKLGDSFTQHSRNPELQQTMHMLAKGAVKGNTVTNLKFEHLTSLFRFGIKNLRPETYKVVSVTVSSKQPLFAKTLTVTGDEKVYSDKVSSMTLSVENVFVSKGETVYAYLNFFPTPDMTADTEIAFSVNVQKRSEPSSPLETIAREMKKVGELYQPESVVAKDGYTYVEGKCYGVKFNLFAELGYEETEPNHYLVKQEEGLVNLANDLSVMTNPETVITLNKDLDFLGKGSWKAIEEFKGSLNGNGKCISNLQIQKNKEDAGLFVKNSGVIKNLTLKDVKIELVEGKAGAFAAQNAGTIQNCVLDGGTLSVNGSNALIGGVTGHNSGTSLVEDCRVTGEVTLTVAGGKVNGGALIGQNGNWSKALVKGCSVDKGVTFVYQGNGEGSIGGLVGWNVQGLISGCSASPTIEAHTAANIGALVGANGGTVNASYTAGCINAKYSKVAGLAKDGGTLVGCYTTAKLPTDVSNQNKIYGVAEKVTKATECYYMFDGMKSPKVGSKVQDASELVGKIESLNQAVLESGFKFVENTAADKNEVPLLIQKVK